MVWHGWYGGQDIYIQDGDILLFLEEVYLRFSRTRLAKIQYVRPGSGSAADWSIGRKLQG